MVRQECPTSFPESYKNVLIFEIISVRIVSLTRYEGKSKSISEKGANSILP